MVRDILDLHSVGGQGVRASEEFPGADFNGEVRRKFVETSDLRGEKFSMVFSMNCCKSPKCTEIL